MARFYRVLLHLYPARHRREYGALMEQLFRDQCRKARSQRGHRGLAVLWLRVLADLATSVPSEQFASLIHTMKTQNVGPLSLKLLIVAIALSAFAAPALVTTGLAPVCLYLSTLALLMRAFVEWHRAREEWLRGLLWMTVMLLLYGFITPFWVKMHLQHGNAYPSVIVVDTGAVLLNAAIALFRPLLPRRDAPPGSPLPS